MIAISGGTLIAFTESNYKSKEGLQCNLLSIFIETSTYRKSKLNSCPYTRKIVVVLENKAI